METLPVPSMIVFLFWQFVPLAFVQALYFCSLPGINMYVPGDCNILLKSVRDSCYRKKTKQKQTTKKQKNKNETDTASETWTGNFEL